MAPNTPIKLQISMPRREAGEAPVPDDDMGGPSAHQAANPDLDPQESDADTDVNTGFPRKSKRFDNGDDTPVHRTKKSKHVYRIKIRLFKLKDQLQDFPYYNGKAGNLKSQQRPLVEEGHCAFLSLEGCQLANGKAVKVNKQNVEAVAPITTTSDTSPPSLISVGLGTVTPISQPATPVDGRISVYDTSGSGCPGQNLLGVGQAHVYEVESDFDAAGRSRTKSFYGVQIARAQDNVAPIAERIPDRTRTAMAPVKDTSKDTTAVYNEIRQVVNTLTDIQTLTHGYLPETQNILVDRLTELTESLSTLKTLTSPTESTSNPIHDVAVAPEIVDYVDDGRNPDIFTRDFVELVQRGNAVINGKQAAFRDFTENYAQKLKEGIPGVSRQVDRVLDNAGFGVDEHDRGKANGVREGVNGNGMMGGNINGKSAGH
jgi:mediator of RNA polymerase II transcription subunit 10